MRFKKQSVASKGRLESSWQTFQHQIFCSAAAVLLHLTFQLLRPVECVSPFRALSISRSSRASRALSTNVFRGEYERCAGCALLLPVQRRSARNVRDRKRNDLKDFHNGFASISQVPDTIYALSTAAGRAAIAVIRVSGPACLDVRFGTGRRPVLANA